MSYDENDAAMDAFYDEVREQLSPDIIYEFKTERLQSYFLKYPEAAKPAYLALEDALRLQESGFSSAAFLFAAIATEVALKTALLKPIVYGLVHNLPISSFITDIVIGQQYGSEKVRKLLSNSLKNIADIDLNSLRRSESNQTLMEEISNLHKKRNSLSHQATMPSLNDSETAVALAKEVLDNLFPQVIAAVNLHQHEYGRVCNDPFCGLKEKYSEKQIAEWRQQYNSNT